MRMKPTGSFALISAVIVVLGPASRAVAQDKPKTEVVPQIGHSSRITSVAFSSDGTLVVSGSEDKTLKIWSVATGTLLRTLEGHANSAQPPEGRVWALGFSPDGRQVLSAGEDNRDTYGIHARGRSYVHSKRAPILSGLLLSRATDAWLFSVGTGTSRSSFGTLRLGHCYAPTTDSQVGSFL